MRAFYKESAASPLQGSLTSARVLWISLEQWVNTRLIFQHKALYTASIHLGKVKPDSPLFFIAARIMLHIALYEPEIPPNTGNIIRLCANTDTQLHLIEPLGFDLDDKKMRRAGLDYREWATIIIHKNFADFLKYLSNHLETYRIFACSTNSKTHYHQHQYQDNDVFLFGPETRGLPESLRLQVGDKQGLKIPMVKNSRSLNLSNAVAITLYEALRQLNFESFDITESKSN